MLDAINTEVRHLQPRQARILSTFYAQQPLNRQQCAEPYGKAFEGAAIGFAVKRGGATLFPCLLLLIAFGREGDGAGMVGLMLYEALCQLACQGRTADDEAHFSVVCDTYGALSYIRQRLASVLPAVFRPGRVPSGIKSGFLVARQAG